MTLLQLEETEAKFFKFTSQTFLGQHIYILQSLLCRLSSSLLSFNSVCFILKRKPYEFKKIRSFILSLSTLYEKSNFIILIELPLKLPALHLLIWFPSNEYANHWHRENL